MQRQRGLRLGDRLEAGLVALLVPRRLLPAEGPVLVEDVLGQFGVVLPRPVEARLLRSGFLRRLGLLGRGPLGRLGLRACERLDSGFE